MFHRRVTEPSVMSNAPSERLDSSRPLSRSPASSSDSRNPPSLPEVTLARYTSEVSSRQDISFCSNPQRSSMAWAENACAVSWSGAYTVCCTTVPMAVSTYCHGVSALWTFCCPSAPSPCPPSAFPGLSWMLQPQQRASANNVYIIVQKKCFIL